VSKKERKKKASARNEAERARKETAAIAKRLQKEKDLSSCNLKRSVV
jgi:hypothetical protein